MRTRPVVGWSTTAWMQAMAFTTCQALKGPTRSAPVARTPTPRQGPLRPVESTNQEVTLARPAVGRTI
eukprot:313247-Alexandrium_andersonii.AAC.1